MIAPELYVGAEVVGRDACHVGGHTLFVELELLLRAPDVGTIEGDVDGNIADQADALAVCVGLDLLPLSDEGILDEYMNSIARNGGCVKEGGKFCVILILSVRGLFLEKSIKYPLTKRQKNSILLWQLYAGVAQW